MFIAFATYGVHAFQMSIETEALVNDPTLLARLTKRFSIVTYVLLQL